MLNPLTTNKKQLNERLRESLEQLRGFKHAGVNAHAPEFRSWVQRTERTISELFPLSQYFRHFIGLRFRATPTHIARGVRYASEWLPADQETFERDSVLAGQLLADAIADSDEPQRQAADAAASIDVWSRVHPLLHAQIIAVAGERFESGHYADAAEAAIKAINVRVKAEWIRAGNTERDGKGLMLAALSVGAPTIVLGDISTMTGRDTQEGYMHLFAGAIQAIRNPKAHDIISITPERACQFLVFGSLLMQKLDEAGIP